MIETNEPKARAPAIVPGRLRNWVEMTIQTRQAQRLVQGRRGAEGKPPIIGLYRYGAMTRTIWSGASKDDPYADWWLLQLEQTLTEAKDDITHMRQLIERDMAQMSAMNVGLAQSLEPTRIELSFSNPYGYMGAWLLADMDELVLAALTARHVGLHTRDASERMLNDAGRAVRRAFAAAQGYRFVAVTRQDVNEHNRRADRAKQNMGEVPQAVVDSTLRAEHAPRLEPLRQPTETDESSQGEANTAEQAKASDSSETANNPAEPDHSDNQVMP